MGLANVLSRTDVTPRARHARRHRGDIDAPQRRVDRRLEPDQLRRRRQHRLRLAELVDRHEARADAELRQQIGDEVKRPAVNGAAAHDLVAGGEERQERGRRRRLSAREDERGLGAFEPGDLRLDSQDGRVGVARVEELRRLPFVVVAHLLRVLEHERRRFVDRGRQGCGIVADAVGDVDELGGWFHDRKRLYREGKGRRSAQFSVGLLRADRRWPPPRAR